MLAITLLVMMVLLLIVLLVLFVFPTIFVSTMPLPSYRWIKESEDETSDVEDGEVAVDGGSGGGKYIWF